MTSFEQKRTNALEKAAKKIEQLKKDLAKAELARSHTDLAIVGVGCNFPGGACSPETFWENLVKGHDGITEVPHDRWNPERYFSSDPDALGKINSKKGGFLTSDVAMFDADFFGISPIEARSMDPQQRLILEVTWQALEHAAINPQRLKGTSTGVYIGTSTNDYGHIFARQMPDEEFNAYYGTGNSSSVTAGRVAYILGTHGPAIPFNASCSSSLVALHFACKALSEGETDLAIAGGVNLILSPQNSIVFSKAHMLSEDGHCKTFDARADGYSRGEGCGVVIIKRLNDALEANDRILCVIKGSAINQDGDSSALTAPNPQALQQVICQALKNSNLTPSDIDFIEAHGSATALGDSVEMEAIKRVFSNREHALTIGTVKTNIGHLESASGIAGLIKVILSLQNGKIPKHLHFNNINPLIDLKPFKGTIPTKTQEWKRNNSRSRCAGVSSFGLNGTNAHLILEEAPENHEVVRGEVGEQLCFLFCFSAKSPEALGDYLKAFIDFLDKPKSNALYPADVSYTLNTGRGQYKHRAVIIASSLLELRNHIKSNHFFFENDLRKMTSVEAKLGLEFLNGQQVNFDMLYTYPARKISLPYYVFQKKRYWLTNTSQQIPANAPDKIHPLLRNPSYSHRHQETSFTTPLSLTYPCFISDHKIYDVPVISSGTCISMLIAFVLQSLKNESVAIYELEFLQPLIVKESDSPLLQLNVNDENHDFEITSFKNRSLKNFTLHAKGKLIESESITPRQLQIDKLYQPLDKEMSQDSVYAFIKQSGLEIGPFFRWIEKINYNDKALVASIRQPAKSESGEYDLFPGIIDACFHATLVWQDHSLDKLNIPIPATIEKITFKRFLSNPRYIYIDSGDNSADILVLDDNGTVLIQLSSMKTKELNKSDLKRMLYFQYMNYAPSYAIDWHKPASGAFKDTGHAKLDDTLLIVSPEKLTLSKLKKNLHPLTVQVEKRFVSIPNLTHVLYIYPHTAKFDNVDDLFQLHQCIQKLYRMPSIQSVGVIINNSLAHSVVEGYWKTLRIESLAKRVYLIESAIEHEKLLATIIKAQCGNYCNENHVAIRHDEAFVPRLLDIKRYLRLSKLLPYPKHEQILALATSDDEKQAITTFQHLQKVNPLEHVLVKYNPPFQYKHNKTYLITGGLGGLGRMLTDHLITLGVKHIVLIGRTQIQKFPAWFTALQSSQNNIQYFSADITDKNAMRTILSDIDQSAAKLGGVFHLAGELVDKSITNLSRNDFEVTFNAKVKGALVLHELTKPLDLDCFVLYSSIASSFGSPGQANYAAANAFLDALAKHRRAKGLAAISINWGPFEAKGMAQNHLVKLQAMGLVPLSPVDAFSAMDKLIGQPLAQAIIADFNWQNISALADNTTILNLVSSHAEKKTPSFVALLKNASKHHRTNLLTNELKKIVAAALSIDDEHIMHEHKEFIEFGIDSLMTVNLWNRLNAMVGSQYTLSKSLLMECTSIAKLTEYFKENVFIDLFDQPVRALNISPKLGSQTSPGKSGKNSTLIKKHPVTKPRPPQKKPNQGDGPWDIFLTGATGTLGGYLTKLILENTDINLHCLIRAKNEAQAYQRLRNMLEIYQIKENILNTLQNRVHVYCGDISCEKFSLSAEEYSHLTNTIDLTIHAAAKISLIDSFEDLYDSNVLGTKNIIKFSLETQDNSLIYISSYSVMGDIQISQNPPFKESDFDLGQSFREMGYQKTKFESERIIRAAGENGLKWRIIRPGDIFGDSNTGVYPLANEITPSVFYDLFKTVTETKVAAITPLYFDITPVDYVAKGILHIALKQKEPFATYHLTNPDVKTLPEIMQILGDLGYPIKLISAEEYIKRIYTHQLKHNGRAYQSLTTSMIQYHSAKIIPEHSTPVDATKTSQILAKANITCPKIDKKLLSILLMYCIDEGYILAQKPLVGELSETAV